MAIAAVAAFVGAFVQSATGFGFALVLGPALFAVLEPVEAVTALLVLGFVLNLLVLFEGGRPGHVDWRALAPVLLAAVPGLAVGLAVLDALSKQALQVGVGVAVILAAGWQLRQRRRPQRSVLPQAAGWAVGFMSGTLTTSISVNGPPLVLWLEARGVAPPEFRASLAASFLALNLAGGVLLLALEGSAALDAAVVLPLLGLVAAGHLLGALAFRGLERECFFAFVLLLVAATGVASIAAGLAG
jgi:uncharacterized protein